MGDVTNTAAFNVNNRQDFTANLNNYREDSVMTAGICMLWGMMTMLSDFAQLKFDEMNAKANRARSSQQAANDVDAVIAQLTEVTSTGSLPSNVLEYLQANKISITLQTDGKSSGVSIDKYLSDNGKELNKGQLESIKGALDADSGRCSDIATQQQLKIQKFMQSYNVTVEMVRSLQDLLKAMNEKIASSISR